MYLKPTTWYAYDVCVAYVTGILHHYSHTISPPPPTSLVQNLMEFLIIVAVIMRLYLVGSKIL